MAAGQTDIAELIGTETLSVTSDGKLLTAEQLGGMTFNALILCEIMLLGKQLIMYRNGSSRYPSMSERRFYWDGYYSLSSGLPDSARVILESACASAMYTRLRPIKPSNRKL